MSDSLQRAMAELLCEQPKARDGWAVARERHLLRERRHLLARISSVRRDAETTPGVPGEISPEIVERLLTDIDHHRQRFNDVAWDEAEVDFGGSE